MDRYDSKGPGGELGLYIHVPFCAGKCPYCDFYSLSPDGSTVDSFIGRTLELMARYGNGCSRTVSTVYFGGGTPSLLGAGRLGELMEGAARYFDLSPGAEITCEVNPTGVSGEFFRELHAAGFNRLSMGMQSANEDELRLLGRKHGPREVSQAVEWARAAGFKNLSLDLMLALPGSTEESLGRSIDFAASLAPEHISAYILKIEPSTPFGSRELALPGEDDTAGQYLFTVKRLGELGYVQYEISNFSRPGYESRHNLCYWRCNEYLGLGPAAHSFYRGRRFHWERDLEGYLSGDGPRDDGPGGDMEEFAMLNLRLTRGLSEEDCMARFGVTGRELFTKIKARAARCPETLAAISPGRVSFTPEGFLVSNALLARLLEDIE